MKAPQKIVQLSDIHLLGDVGESLEGVDACQNLEEVRAAIETEMGDFDLMVLTGDLAHEGTEKAYSALRRVLGPWWERVRCVPGNHDFRGAFSRVLKGRESEEQLGFEHNLNGWRVIGLDTLMEGKAPGRLQKDQIHQLEAARRSEPEMPTLLFMHHPPLPVGSSWIDAMSLENPADLERVASDWPGLRGVFCGHVHQDFVGSLGGVPVWTTPSTAIQILPGSDQFVLDTRFGPGWRLIRLYEDTIETEVFYLPRKENAG